MPESEDAEMACSTRVGDYTRKCGFSGDWFKGWIVVVGGLAALKNVLDAFPCQFRSFYSGRSAIS